MANAVRNNRTFAKERLSYYFEDGSLHQIKFDLDAPALHGAFNKNIANLITSFLVDVTNDVCRLCAICQPTHQRGIWLRYFGSGFAPFDLQHRSKK